MRRRILLVLLVLVLAAALGPMGYLLWLRSHGEPLRAGQAPLFGLSSSVEVRFDRWGVPHVDAGSAIDLARTLGYLHANDRFTQMELGRRAAAGRLSELFGERTLEVDREHRRLRLRRAAEELWRSLEGESRDWLEAYAEGVNAWLGEREGDLPPLLHLLRHRPEPWQPVDSLSFVFLMAKDLSFWAGRPEEERFVWLRDLGKERALDLIAAGSGEEVHVPAPLLAMLSEAERAPLPGADGSQQEPDGGSRQTGSRQTGSRQTGSRQTGSPGSNNWALGAGRTASGGPLLANDPHLPLQLPATWYQVLLRSPELEVAGVTLPGVPGVVIGHNGHIAWAVTHTMLDDHDLFFERIDDEGKRVRRGDGWEEIRVEQETIRLRDGAAVPLTLLSTDIGPLLEPDLELRIPARSLAWTAYEGGDPLAAFLGLARAETLEEVPQAVSSYVAPSQNLVVAHRDGGLLYTVLGRLPSRRTGDGRLPSPGWDRGYGWDGLRPWQENPVRLEPAAGLLVTANNDLRDDSWPESFVADFDLPHRARRIEELLVARQDWRGEDLLGVQTDVISSYARELVGLLAEEYEGNAARAYETLRAWDGGMELRGPAALFALTERALGLSIFGDEAKRFRTDAFDNRHRLLAVLAGEMSEAWLDDVMTETPEDRRIVLGRALALAWDQAVARWGPEPSDWDYGELHQLLLRHPAGAAPVIGDWYDRGPFPTAGSATTVAAFGARWTEESLPVAYGPSMRFVADLADLDRSILVLPSGQSGHPGDLHYDDQLQPFRNGEGHRMHWSEEAIAAATVSTLRLAP